MAGRTGSFYVTDQVPRLSWFGGDGKLLGRCRPVLNGAHGMWRDAKSGVIYLAEQTPSRITRLVPVVVRQGRGGSILPGPLLYFLELAPPRGGTDSQKEG